MRYSLILFALFTWALSVLGGEQTSDFAEAQKLSSELNKPILIDFMTDW